MALEGFQPIVLRTFGGLCTSIDRLSLGPGMSPNCQNVRFDPGTVGSRYGYTAFTGLYDSHGPASISLSGADIRAIHAYTPPGGTPSLVLLTPAVANAGLQVRVDGTGDTTLLANVGSETSGPLTLKADAAFGRLFFTVTDATGRNITDPSSYFTASGRLRTYQYSGSAGRRVRQIAPGPPAWKSGVSNYVKASAGAGGLAVGDHYYAWLYIAEDGYITAVGSGGYFNIPDAANTLIEVAGAPIGPTGTKGRILALTAAGDVNLFWLWDKTVFMNNTTTSAILTVRETELITLGEPARAYTTLYTPAAPDGLVAYSDRLCLWGSREKSEVSFTMMPSAIGTAYQIIGAPNLDFKGGYDTGTNKPNYWVPLGTGSTGFVMGTDKDTLVVNSSAVATHGMSLTGSIDGVYIPPDAVMNIRARVKGSFAGAGVVTIAAAFTGTIGGAVTPSLSMTVTENGFSGNSYIAKSTNATAMGALGAPPFPALATVIITITCTTPPTASIEIDWIELYNSLDYSWQNTLRVSRARDPESFDSVTGLVQIPPDGGERIKTCFKFRDALYVAKDRSLYVTRDTGDEPVTWPVDLVDRQSGTPSIHGVGYGDGWVVILSRIGLILFDGATPQVISQEIAPTWQTIDWADPCTAWVLVDVGQKQVKIGCKVIGQDVNIENQNSLLLTLDYTEGFGNPVPSGMGRKWSVDSVLSTKPGYFTVYNHATTAIDRFARTRQLYAITATPNGASLSMGYVTYQDNTLADVYKWNDFPDIGVAGQGPIYATYETAPVGPELGRATFDRLVLRARGSGYMTVSFVEPDGTTQTVGASSPALTSTPSHDIELRSNAQETSVGIRMSMASRSDWFVLRRIGLFLKDATYGEFRGKQDHAAS